MLKKSIKYKNLFTDEEITKDFYFNLSKAEIAEMELSRKGGLKAHLEAIVEAEDGKAIMQEMREIILKAYGKRSGESFIKNDEVREEFSSSEAYSELFMELVTDAAAAGAFVRGIVPTDLRDAAVEENIKEKTAEQLGTRAVDTPNLRVADEPRKLTEAEVREMDADELKSGLATGKYVISNDLP